MGFKESTEKVWTALLKSFRGLICEKKDGGWELSQGRVMAWLIFYKFTEAATGTADSAGVEWLFYGWLAAMTYCGYSKTDMGGMIGKIRGAK